MESYTSGYHAAMKEKIDHRLMEDPEYATVCYQYMKALRTGTFDSELVNAIFQEWERHEINIYDAYLFSSIWSSLCYGEILWTSIEIGEEPLKDSSRKENSTSIYIFYCTDKWPRLDMKTFDWAVPTFDT